MCIPPVVIRAPVYCNGHFLDLLDFERWICTENKEFLAKSGVESSVEPLVQRLLVAESTERDDSRELLCTMKFWVHVEWFHHTDPEVQDHELSYWVPRLFSSSNTLVLATILEEETDATLFSSLNAAGLWPELWTEEMKFAHAAGN